MVKVFRFFLQENICRTGLLLTATTPSPLHRFLYTEKTQQVVAIVSNKLWAASGRTWSEAGPEGQLNLDCWPRGPAKVCRPWNVAAVKRILTQVTTGLTISVYPVNCGFIRGLETFAGPLGQQLIFGWPSGPATDLVRPVAAHSLLWPVVTTCWVISVHRKWSNGPGIVAINNIR